MQDLVDHADFCRACRGRGYFSDPTGRGTFVDNDCDQCRGTGLRTVLVLPSSHRAADTAKCHSTGGANSTGGDDSCSTTLTTEAVARPFSSDISAAPTQSLPGASSLTGVEAGGAASNSAPPAIPFPNPRNHAEEIENLKAMEANRNA